MTDAPALPPYPSWAPTTAAPRSLSLSDSTEAVLDAARTLLGALVPFAEAMGTLADALDAHDSAFLPPTAPSGNDPTRGGPTFTRVP